MSVCHLFGTLTVDTVGDCGYIEPEGDGLGIFVVQKDVTFDLSSFSGSSVSVEFSLTEDGLGKIKAFDVKRVIRGGSSSRGAIENVIQRESSSSSGRYFGTLQSLDTMIWIGFGTIIREGDHKAIYAHRTNVTFDLSSVSDSARVSFLVKELGNNGIEAVDIRLDVIEKGSGTSSVYLQHRTRCRGVYESVVGPDGLNTVSGYCFRCCENGHEASDCDAPEGHGGGGCDPTADHSGCYYCDGKHRARDCPLGYNGSGFRGECYLCGGAGHMARECPNNDRGGGFGGNCYSCGEPGHIARECPDNNRGGGIGGDRYNPGRAGHMARDLPGNNRGGNCYTCGEPGHIARECPDNNPGGGFGGNCYSCGEPGHIARYCPDNNSGGCTTCGKPGHATSDCRVNER